MPAHIFKCPEHGEQERFKCSFEQVEIPCNIANCNKVAVKVKRLNRMGFTCKGGHDSGFKPK